MTTIESLQDNALPKAPSSALRVVVAAVACPSDLSGVSRHAANLVRCLLAQEDVGHIHLVLGNWQRKALEAILPVSPRLHIHSVTMGAGAFARNLWYYKRLPKLTREFGADVLHLTYPVPVRRTACACPVVVTLHDLYPYDVPENFGFPKALFNRSILQQCLNSVSAIACVSESTHRRLQMYAHERVLNRATVIYNCVEAGPPESDTSPIPGWTGEPFLLCVAQHRRNKNIALAISTFDALLNANEIAPGSRLIIVGITGPETPAIHRQIRDCLLEDKVVLLTGISEAELAWCYAHCFLLLAPSSVEGFGLPVVEAILHHCRIVCSDIPPFREVGGKYCFYANLDHDPAGAFLQATRTALAASSFRAGNTERFSMQRIGEQYVTLYRSLIPHEAVESALNLHAAPAEIESRCL